MSAIFAKNQKNLSSALLSADSFISLMSLATQLSRLLGIRSSESQTVQLFFLHHFFLGLGTMLVYVSANVILLENDPETSLPLAYVSSALGMVAISKLYEHYEHHWALSKLVVRVLVGVMLLTGVVVVLVGVGHSVALSVAIMVAYRGIYLLSSGDMPAKAMGAILAALVHGHTQIIVLLAVALLFFGAALFTVQLTVRSHDIQAAAHSTRSSVSQSTRLVRRLFGGSKLVFALCLSMTSVAGIAAAIEYAFFVNVKHRFHDQATVMQYLGYVLALTYLLALFVKLIVLQRSLERWGLLALLRWLPAVAAVGILGLGFVNPNVESQQMVFFGGLYLILEVLRRAIFDPIFLVLFQPLLPSQRLHSHTLAKGLYEPLGLGMAGVLIFVLHAVSPLPARWLLLGWVVACSLAALFLLGKTYRHYLLTLREALHRRFLADAELAMPSEAIPVIISSLRSKKAEDVIHAIDWLRQYQPAMLLTESGYLLGHTQAKVRQHALHTFIQTKTPIQDDLLAGLVATDPVPKIRELAAQVYSQYLLKTNETLLASLLIHPDLWVRKGGIEGCLAVAPQHQLAGQQLVVLCESPAPEAQVAALSLVYSLRLSSQAAFVERCLSSTHPAVVDAAIEAAGYLPQEHIIHALIGFLHDPYRWRLAAQSLVHLSTQAIAPLAEMASSSDDPVLVKRIAGIGQKMQSFEAYELLVKLAQRPHLFIRKSALEVLVTFPSNQSDAVIFEELLHEELTFAQRLIGGETSLPDSLQAAILYEKELCISRILLILKQLNRKTQAYNVLSEVMSTSQDRQANSLELLDNLIPRTVYVCLQAIVEDLPPDQKIKQLNAQLGPSQTDESLLDFIIWRGDNFFSAWTISLAIRHAATNPTALTHLAQYFFHPNALLRESVLQTLQQLQQTRPSLFAQLTRNFPEVMQQINPSHTISLAERVIVLKNTSLFSETPEGIISVIAPIMQEVSYSQGEEIFQKGSTGNCMFAIFSGEVAIYDGPKHLATFSNNDIFGELALLDTEARSGTAVALSDLRLLKIAQADFYDLMEDRSEVLRSIIRILCQRLRAQNQN
jgi:hypothetical protein